MNWSRYPSSIVNETTSGEATIWICCDCTCSALPALSVEKNLTVVGWAIVSALV
jgi:hypothetical protein